MSYRIISSFLCVSFLGICIPFADGADSAVNTKCPISGKAIKAKCAMKYEGEKIAFCCGKCFKKFKSDPATLVAKVVRDAVPVNAACPMSGKDIKAGCVAVYKEEAIGFCGGGCKKKFEADPAAMIGKLVRTSKKQD